MQAIRTKYMPATNTKGSKIQAKCEAATIYVNWDHGLSVEENHWAACKALLTRCHWGFSTHGGMFGGVFNNDYYWVFAKMNSSPYAYIYIESKRETP